MSARRCDELRLTGSGGANRVMEAELKRLVMRSPFDVRVEKPKREGESTLLYPFDAAVPPWRGSASRSCARFRHASGVIQVRRWCARLLHVKADDEPEARKVP